MKCALAASRCRSVFSVVRLGAALVLAMGALVFSGCTSLSVQRDFDTIVSMVPAPTLVTPGREFRAAETAASRITGAQAFSGAGDSMKPIYASGTALVVMPCDYRQLQRGMPVVYVNHRGQGVAHVLINEVGTGWIAQGVNNADEDNDLVTAGNLVGVITQAYASADTPLRREIARRVALKTMASLSKIPGPLALNLPKTGSAGAFASYQ